MTHDVGTAEPSVRSVKLGTGLAFWGDALAPAAEMVKRADIDYLCCDHLAELTMSILGHLRSKNPGAGYVTDFPDLVARLSPILADQAGLKIVTNAGG